MNDDRKTPFEGDLLGAAGAVAGMQDEDVAVSAQQLPSVGSRSQAAETDGVAFGAADDDAGNAAEDDVGADAAASESWGSGGGKALSPAQPEDASVPAESVLAGEDEVDDEAEDGGEADGGGVDGSGQGDVGVEADREEGQGVEAGEPGQPAAWPSVPVAAGEDKETQEAASLYWKQILTGDPDTVPETVRKRAGADDPNMTAEQRNYMLYSAINRSWAVDHLGRSREDVASDWPKVRAQLASQLGVSDEEQEIFLGLSNRVADEPRREAARHIYEIAWLAGFHGEKAYDVGKWKAGLLPEDDEAAESLAISAYREGQAVQAQYGEYAKTLANGLEVFSAMEEDAISAPRVLASFPDLFEAIDTLPLLPEEERKLVLMLAADEFRRRRKDKQGVAGGEDEGWLSRVSRAFRRNSVATGYNLLQWMNQAHVASINSLGRVVGGRAGRTLRNVAGQWDERARMLDELRHLVTDELQPLVPPGASKAEEYLIYAAEAVPAAMLSLCGGMGFNTLFLSGVGQSIMAARRRSPASTQELQYLAGMIGGAIQASIYIGLNRVGGKVLERSISDFMAARGAGLARYSLAGLRSLGAATAQGAGLLAAGKLSAASDLALQEGASYLSDKASNIDWKQFGNNLIDIEANMREAAALLPFLLIGSGRMALRHFRSPRAILGDGKGLLEWGIEEKQIKELMAERDINRQSEMLTDMLRHSSRWAGSGFIPWAAKIMRLLNIEYFEGFKDVETVRDFLKVPSETTMIEKADMGTEKMTAQKLAHLPGHGPSRFHVKVNTERRRDALRLWDEWWRNSHYSASRSYAIQLSKKNLSNARRLRIESYLRINQNPYDVVPRRMRRSGIYAPFAEGERRALLRDRVQEAKDLSYQFVMQLYSLDAMATSDIPLGDYRRFADISRNTVLGEVAKCVLRTVLESQQRVQSLDELEGFFHKVYASTSYHEGIPSYMEKQPLTLPDFPSVGNPREFRAIYNDYEPEPLEAYRITTGMRACANTLIDLLPMMDDFQTALARGMTPAQAYHHLLVRELAFDPSKVSGYPLQKLSSQRNITPLMNTKLNFDKCGLYGQLTGNVFESAAGENGRTYWRLKRPDGSYSRWHETCDQAANDVAANAALSFMAFGDGANVRWQRLGSKREFDIRSLPLAGEGVFSGYDQLCSQALNDLSRFWYANGTRVQPGMFFKTPYGSRFRGLRGKDGITPWVREKDALGQELYFDRYTVATPLALAHSRFRAWWSRALGSGLVDAKQGLDFLVREGRMDEEVSRQLLATPLIIPRRGRPWHQPEDLGPDWEKINDSVAEELASYTTLYFVSNLNRLQLPSSVKTWFGMSAFCPPPPKAVGYTPENGLLVVGVKRDRTGLVNWSNRQTVLRLHEMAPEVEALRNKYPDGLMGDPFFQRLINQAMGVDEGQNYEQGWCVHLGGPGIIHGVTQSYWNLLQMPREGWKRMPVEEKEDMRTYLQEFCEHEPAPEALDILARGGKPDYVQTAIDNLDAVLKEFPELHRYAPVEDDASRVRVQLPDELMPEMGPEEEPRRSPLPFQGPEMVDMERGSVYKAYSLPEFMQEDSRAGHALRFLNVLRHYAIGRPYTLDSGIWWKNAFYGGLDGRHPWGLMHWQPSLPLMPMRQMLGQLYEIKQANGKALSICGNQLDGVPPEYLSPRELDLATVYRSPENRGLLYRLMPGEPNSINYRARTPYMVGCRMGVYLMGHRTATEGAHRPYIMTPLQEFRPAVWRNYSPAHVRQWKEENIRDALDHVLWRANRVRAMRDPSSGMVNMAELMMRLFEDTGFSQNLANTSPENLSISQSWLLRLAADMFRCLNLRQDRYYPESREAYNRLSKTAQALRKSKEIYELVIQSLMDTNESLAKDSSLYSHISEALAEQFDQLEGREPKEPEEWKEPKRPIPVPVRFDPPAKPAKRKRRGGRHRKHRPEDEQMQSEFDFMDSPDPERNPGRFPEEE